MSKLLYIESSPRKERSASIRVARVFLDAYIGSHHGHEVQTLDLWDCDLPPFDGQTINAKYAIMHGLEHTPAQAAAWRRVADIAEQFKRADRYLFSVPMWNFGIPYVLKHYIDVLTQPGLTFSFSPAEGYKGLVTGKPAVVIYARGGEYPPGSGMAAYDFQRPYLETVLGFIGFTDIRGIVVEPTLRDQAQTDQVIAAAEQLARQMALVL